MLIFHPNHHIEKSWIYGLLGNFDVVIEACTQRRRLNCPGGGDHFEQQFSQSDQRCSALCQVRSSTLMVLLHSATG
ncbi:hypothetical protein AALO_G00250370, partial [Alosa alosa]